MSLLVDPSAFKVKVSSTLNKDSKSFGKQFLHDGSLETCWNSDQGASQWVIIEFAKPVSAGTLHLMFQGGFSSSEVQIFVAPSSTPSSVSGDWTLLTTIYPEDSNKNQSFLLSEETAIAVHSVKLGFSKPTDTYGRIVLYKVDLLG